MGIVLKVIILLELENMFVSLVPCPGNIEKHLHEILTHRFFKWIGLENLLFEGLALRGAKAEPEKIMRTSFLD
jgi:hypothetical protein